MDTAMKARAQRADSKGWVYGYAMIRNDGEAMMYIPESRNTYAVVKETIGMCSDKRACDGKFIYNGDIVKFTFDNQKITSTIKTINQVPFCVELPFFVLSNINYIPIGIVNENDIEILGNIFD